MTEGNEHAHLEGEIGEQELEKGRRMDGENGNACGELVDIMEKYREE
jgi:hypothetical protein